MQDCVNAGMGLFRNSPMAPSRLSHKCIYAQKRAASRREQGLTARILPESPLFSDW